MESDCNTFIRESTVIYEQGKPTIVYEELDWDCADVVRALQNIEYKNDFRTDGLTTNSRTFGFLPRNVIRRDFCTAAAMAMLFPDAHQIICDYSSKVAERYQAAHPTLYQDHNERAAGTVIADYKLQGSPFTSGIVNYNTALKYHFDKGNFNDVWSAMLVFKHHISGGYLAVPQYDLLFELKHNSLLMFDGQGLLHGVTPIRKRRADAFRYSVVYYSMQAMWQCLTPGEEMQRIRTLKTKRERKRIEPNP